MKPLKNAYAGVPGFYCFCCSRKNPYGLKMEFFEDGPDIVCIWRPKPEFQGFPNRLHGGIQSTLLDETACWAVFVKQKTAGFTVKMDIRFRHAVSIEETLTLRARIKETRRNLVKVQTTLSDGKARVCTEADVTYFTFSAEQAAKGMAYPGHQAFMESGD